MANVGLHLFGRFPRMQSANQALTVANSQDEVGKPFSGSVARGCKGNLFTSSMWDAEKASISDVSRSELQRSTLTDMGVTTRPYLSLA